MIREHSSVKYNIKYPRTQLVYEIHFAHKHIFAHLRNDV